MAKNRTTLRKWKPRFTNVRFTKHFLERYKQRISPKASERNIKRAALQRLNASRLIGIEGPLEFRAHKGDIFVIDTRRNTLITVFYCRLKHDINRMIWQEVSDAGYDVGMTDGEGMGAGADVGVGVGTEGTGPEAGLAR